MFGGGLHPIWINHLSIFWCLCKSDYYTHYDRVALHQVGVILKVIVIHRDLLSCHIQTTAKVFLVDHDSVQQMNNAHAAMN